MKPKSQLILSGRNCFFKFLPSALFLLFVWVGCSKNSPENPNTSSSKSDQEPQVVHMAAWSSYVNMDLLKRFEAETKIKVEVSHYSSNEELLAKLQAGATGFDIAIPSDYMVFAMAKLGLLLALDKAMIPNITSLSETVLKRSYDPANTYSVPYTWGTTGIAYRTDRFKGKIEGYADLLENAELKGHFSLLDDVREGLGVGLKRNQLSLNTHSAQDLSVAKKTLLAARKNIKAFSSETLNLLVSGDVIAAQAYSCDAYQARRKTGGKVDFIIPKEGCTLWIDNLVVPKGGKNPTGAHRLINFLMAAESNRLTATSILIAPANAKAIPLLEQAFLKEFPNILPDSGALKKCEMMEDIGDAITLYDRVWTEVKVGRGNKGE